jgi:thioredoxin-related protein
MPRHIAYPSLLVVRFRLRLLWLVLVWIAALSVVSARDFDDSELAHVAYPDWFKESFLDLRDDLADAEAEGKAGIMVLFTTEGCSYCAQFIRRTLGDEAIAARVRSRFDAIGLEMFSDAEMVGPGGDPMRVKELAEREGAGFSPTLLFFEENGREVLRTDALVLPQRMVNSLLYTLERAYEKEWTYQRFARSKALERRSPQPEPSGG